ncbi:glycosylase [Bacillus sp. DNRA2]|nr:glycosylase [Bacillus sp. DNRA2]
MGYLYFGNTQNYIEGINQTANTINVVSPSYFDLNSDGSLKLTANFDRQFIVSSQSAGVRVVPFLSNHWDRATGEIALKNRDQLSTQIAEAVKLYNLDGVNIDIENVTAEHRDEYTDFVRLLREKIPQNKEVSVAVAANPNGLTSGWNGSYDYSGIAKYSDYLMIMAYDESYPGSAAGPIASISFVEDSIQYAISQGVDKDQIVVGVGHYGRYWKEGTSYGGDGISNNQIQKALELYNGTVTFDEATKSAKAVFTIKKGDPVMTVSGKPLTEGTYTVWFENSEAIKAKIDLIHQYDVKGLGNWSIGQDNPLIWKDISAWLQVGSTPEAGQTTLGGE